MKRETLIKHTPRELLNRLVRLSRISGINMEREKEDEENEVELSNTFGLIEDRLYNIKTS